ncbi:hypothetical protein DKX38_008075 [Salix brachista]|uniref:Uncharacterized protein n=1 Tax=Salix brachista TaxID=2182728 RepID=A0A5N5MSD2_9ROSI|nr:hypothetical protein DKX38_008075 [Salix brachista]
MTSAIGWYGPLVDLCKTDHHIGDIVQLLVFVHRSTPVQYKLSKGGEVIRTDIQVGDDTLPFFSVSLWKKQMGTMVVAGDILLLQNVKITKFGHAVEARTVEWSSVVRLVHPYESLLSKGVGELIEESQVGKTTLEKLCKVIKWVQRARSALHTTGSHSFVVMSLLSCFVALKKQLRNWKLPKQSESQNLLLLSEVLGLSNSCNAIFNASIGEIFLPFTRRALDDSNKEKMFVSRTIEDKDNSLAEDFICIGCQLCGSPLVSENRSICKQDNISLYCPKSLNHVHAVTLIYRPFMSISPPQLYVWDESEYLPLLVRNKAAVVLFGNIRAERVYSCYRGQNHSQNANQTYFCRENNNEAVKKGLVGSCSSDADKSLEVKKKNHHNKNMNFHLIWLVLLKMLLQQGKNSPMKFEATVNTSLDTEHGKFEMLSVSVPCARNKLFSG